MSPTVKSVVMWPPEKTVWPPLADTEPVRELVRELPGPIGLSHATHQDRDAHPWEDPIADDLGGKGILPRSNSVFEMIHPADFAEDDTGAFPENP